MWLSQPRQLVAREIATWLAKQADGGSPSPVSIVLEPTSAVEYGEGVSLETREAFVTPQENHQARIRVMTDSMILKHMEFDEDLCEAAVVIVDEVHERSPSMDRLLGLLVRVSRCSQENVSVLTTQLLKRRADLKVLVMSATAEHGNLVNFFDTNAIPVEFVSLPGSTYVRNLRYIDSPCGDIAKAVGIEVHNIFATPGLPKGDVIVFCDGNTMISSCQAELQVARSRLPRNMQKGIDIIPLYRGMGAKEQQQALADQFVHATWADGSQKPFRICKIILATSIAETITFPHAVYVLDSCLTKAALYDARAGAHELITVPTSKAQSEQRAGRVGRVRDGYVLRLVTREDWEKLDDFPEPPILQADLTRDLLSLIATIGTKEVADLPWPSEWLCSG